MYAGMKRALDALLGQYGRDEHGQEILTWVLIIFLLWLLIGGGRVVLQ